MDKINLIIDKVKAFFEKIDSLSVLNRTPSKKFIITAFIAAILFIGLLSGLTVVNEFKDNNNETTQEISTEEIISDIGEKDVQNICGNFLFVLTQDGNEKIELLALTRLDSENNKVSISFVNPEEKTSVNGLIGTMQEHLNNGGINELDRKSVV